MTDPVDFEIEKLFREDIAAASEALPPPSVIWWKAELTRRRELREKALSPLRWMQMAGVAASAVLMVFLLASFVAKTTSLPGGSFSMSAIVLAGCASLMMLLVGMRLIAAK